MENFVVTNQDLIKDFSGDMNRNMVRKISKWNINLRILFQKKAYILNLQFASESLGFITQNILKLDTYGYFIHIMNESAINVENFLTNKFIEQMVNTIVLNFRDVAEGRSVINVHTNRYFSNKRRIEPFILGAFIDKKFIVLDQKSRQGLQLNFFPEKMKNMDNFEFQVSAFNYPPKVLII